MSGGLVDGYDAATRLLGKARVRIRRVLAVAGDALVARWPHVVGLAAFAVVYAYMVRDVVLGRLYAFGDFPPYYGAQALEKFTATWHYQELGYAYIYNTLPAYLGVVTGIAGPLGQNLFYLALLPAGFLTFLVFSGRFVDRLPARYVAAGLYALNPVTIGEFESGGAGALIGFVGFPLVLHYLFAVVEDDEWRDAVKAGMVFGATTIVPWLAFWMIGPFATYLAYRARRAPRTLAKLVAAGSLGLVLALPNVHHVLQRAGQFDEGRSVLVDTLVWNYQTATLPAVLRLAGNHGMRVMNELGYNTAPTMVVGLVVPLVALAAWRRRDLVVFYAVASVGVAFIVLTGRGVTYPLFDLLPPLWSLRNPVKLQYPMLLSLCVLFGAGAATILDGIGPAKHPLTPVWRRTDSVATVAVVALLVLPLFAYAAPASGALGLQSLRGDDYYVHEEVDSVADRLDGKALWVPYGYTTQLRLRNAHPNHVGVKSGGVLHGIQNTEYVAAFFDDFAAGRPVDARLESLGVKYVVVSTDPPARYGDGPPRLVWKWGAPWLWGDPARFESRLADAPAYSVAFRTDHYTVYRVEGVRSHGRFERRTGLSALVYPERSIARAVGPNLLANPDFEDGTEGWWIPPDVTARVVDDAGGGSDRSLVLSAEEPAPNPIAQKVPVRRRYPYRVDVDAEGEGVVHLFWYEGSKSPENQVSTRTVPLSSLPLRTTARGDLLSIRVQPNGTGLRVHGATLARTTYPRRTGFEANLDDVPGVVSDARDAPPAAASIVAVNLDESAAEAANASVRVVDAETVLPGELVFDPDYRQGVAVRMPDDGLPAEVPDDARVVTHETPEGPVLDYWVVGTFDDTPVTVLRTSYDERWSGPPDAEHFRAYGWANGFTGASPEQVRWTGDPYRGLVVRAWIAAWIVTVLGLAATAVVGSWRRRRATSGPPKL